MKVLKGKKVIGSILFIYIFLISFNGVNLYNSISKEKYNGDPQISVESDLQI